MWKERTRKDDKVVIVDVIEKECKDVRSVSGVKKRTSAVLARKARAESKETTIV